MMTEKNELINQAKEKVQEVCQSLDKIESLVSSITRDSNKVSNYSGNIHDQLIDLGVEYQKILKHQSRSTELLEMVRKHLAQIRSDQKDFFESLLEE